MNDRDHDIADEYTAATRGRVVDALRDERAAHAATREELRRVVAALASARESYDLAVANLPPIARDAVQGYFVGVDWSAAPAFPSTEAAVRAGIDDSAQIARERGRKDIAEAIESLDAAAIAARLEGR